VTGEFTGQITHTYVLKFQLIMFVMIYNNNGNNTVDVIKSAANQSRLAINRFIFKEGRGSE
jgi:hypothetical protein